LAFASDGPVIGLLSRFQDKQDDATAFRRQAQELGFGVAGSLRFQTRSSEVKPERLNFLAINIVSQRPSVIVTRGDSARAKSLSATNRIQWSS
jgi:hypothetical protein